MREINILGIEIDNISYGEALARICELIKTGEVVYVVAPNVDHVIKLQSDAEFRRIYENASLVLADGMPLLWAARFLGTPLKGKISGSDLFPELCAFAAEKGYKLFFLGGRPGAALKAAEVLRAKHPGIQIVGIYSPPFGFENDVAENRKIIQMIRDAKPDILFVGLGAPKQEKWIFSHYKELNVPISIGIGVSFEFVSGMVRRAPLWMQRIGLEWFWRLMMEPRRLWKRYLVDDMKFLYLVLKQKLGQC